MKLELKKQVKKKIDKIIIHHAQHLPMAIIKRILQRDKDITIIINRRKK